jgi:hypothetical protein
MADVILTSLFLTSSKGVVITLPVWQKILDAISSEVSTEWNYVGPDYEECTIFWGAFRYARGEKVSLRVHGKPH